MVSVDFNAFVADQACGDDGILFFGFMTANLFWSADILWSTYPKGICVRVDLVLVV